MLTLIFLPSITPRPLKVSIAVKESAAVATAVKSSEQIAVKPSTKESVTVTVDQP